MTDPEGPALVLYSPECPTCSGKGVSREYPNCCPRCGGRGYIQATRTTGDATTATTMTDPEGPRAEFEVLLAEAGALLMRVYVAALNADMPREEFLRRLDVEMQAAGAGAIQTYDRIRAARDAAPETTEGDR